MAKSSLVAFFLIAATALVIMPQVFPAYSQEDIRTLSPEAFMEKQRPACLFNHDEHNEKAGIEECGSCHHGETADGKQDFDDTSEGVECSECHKVSPDPGRTGLMNAYHTQCKKCHEEKGKGPLACGECHVK